MDEVSLWFWLQGRRTVRFESASHWRRWQAATAANHRWHQLWHGGIGSMLVCLGVGVDHMSKRNNGKNNEMCWTIMLKHSSGMIHTCIGEGMPKTHWFFPPPVVPCAKLWVWDVTVYTQNASTFHKHAFEGEWMLETHWQFFRGVVGTYHGNPQPQPWV